MWSVDSLVSILVGQSLTAHLKLQLWQRLFFTAVWMGNSQSQSLHLDLFNGGPFTPMIEPSWTPNVFLQSEIGALLLL